MKTKTAITEKEKNRLIGVSLLLQRRVRNLRKATLDYTFELEQLADRLYAVGTGRVNAVLAARSAVDIATYLREYDAATNAALKDVRIAVDDAGENAAGAWRKLAGFTSHSPNPENR